MDRGAPPLPAAAASNESLSAAIVGIAIALIVVCILAVSLRFWSRLVIKEVGLWWDDWAVLATTFFTVAFYACSIAWTTVGLGKHQSTLPLSDITPNGVLAQVALMVYDTAISLLKVSAAMLYARIFKSSRRFRWTIWAFIGVVTVWWILLLIIPFTHCDPPRKLMFPLIKGTCSLKSVPWFLSTAFINFFLDIAVLVMPIPMVWTLQLRRARKLQLIGVFLLGYSSAFVGLARFIFVVRNSWVISPVTDHDLTWNMVPNEILALFELALGIVAVCGPAIRQLVQRRTRDSDIENLDNQNKSGSSSFRRLLWYSRRSRNDSSTASGSSQKSWEGTNTGHSLGHVEYSSSPDGMGPEVPVDGLLLKRDVQVTREAK